MRIRKFNESKSTLIEKNLIDTINNINDKISDLGDQGKDFSILKSYASVIDIGNGDDPIVWEYNLYIDPKSNKIKNYKDSEITINRYLISYYIDQTYKIVSFSIEYNLDINHWSLLDIKECIESIKSFYEFINIEVYYNANWYRSEFFLEFIESLSRSERLTEKLSKRNRNSFRLKTTIPIEELI
jgi:hypothetical protein